MKLIATTELRYATRNLMPGDEFECNDTDAHVLKTIGKAKDAPKAAPKAATQPSNPQQEPGGLNSPTQEEDAPKPSRRYLRRDMRSQE